MTGCLSLIRNVLSQLFDFGLPGIALTFGGLIVGVFGVPLLIKSIKKFF